MNAIPTVTKNLLIINVLVFLATIVAQSYHLDLARYLGLHFFLADDFNVAQLITYMFMHGGFTHLFFNMFAVWMFGRILEQVWGPKRFLSYYMICGIGAGLISMLVTYIRIQAAKTGMSPEMINTVYQEGAQIIRDNMNYTYPPMANLNALLRSYRRSFRSRICHFAGLRNAVPQPAAIHISVAVSDKSQILCYRICTD